MTHEHLAPIHPGEILSADFLEPLGMTQYRLAKNINVHPRRINEIVHGKRGISADTALRFSRLFGTSPQFWLNIQDQYELDTQQDLLGDELAEIVPLPLEAG